MNAFRRDDRPAGAADGEAGEPVFHLPPPPEGTHPTHEELERTMHAWSLEHGYELVRRASKKNAKGVLYKRYYHCSKHGKLANTGRLTDETRVRVNRRSNRIGCPMSLAVVALDPTNPDGEWQIRHRKTHHNHGPLDALALAGHRRRARLGGVEKAVDGLFAIGTPTAQVLQFLQRTNPGGLFTRTDVANMKLKYKKYGTCADRRDHAQPDYRPGFPSACLPCRTRKVKCDSQRPGCSSCTQSGQTCEYDHEPGDARPALPHDASGSPDATGAEDDDHQPPPGTPPRDQPAARTGPGARPPAPRAEEILANLQSFRAAHVKPAKLSLQSSSVEVLAASSCGSGDSYRNVPTLRSTDRWPAYRDAVTEASMKENTYEVLVGTKTEPAAPPDPCSVEDWNEYIKQLAIFNRRNTALAGALLGTLGPSYRSRVHYLKSAAEMWQVLEDLCLPRGSDHAFRLYLELNTTAYQNSADLKEYIIRLETAHVAFNSLSRESAAASSSAARRLTPGNPAAAGKAQWSAVSSRPDRLDAFTEDMLCFLFLKNLGPDFRPWVENVSATNNIAGFGTGPRLAFVDLTRRALEWEAVQRRGGGA